MKYFLPILFFIMGCGSKMQLDKDKTLLDKDYELVESETIAEPTRKIDSVVVDILNKHNNLRQTSDTDFDGLVSEGLINVKELRDTVANSYVHVKFSIYQDLKASFKAFRNYIETEACCVPDEDIVKLKNYENLTAFKNGASKIMLTDNTVITMYLGDNINDNKRLNELIDSYFIDGHLRKLEIGHGGPAIWTIK